jgi:hypothetical protein
MITAVAACAVTGETTAGASITALINPSAAADLFT